MSGFLYGTYDIILHYSLFFCQSVINCYWHLRRIWHQCIAVQIHISLLVGYRHADKLKQVLTTEYKQKSRYSQRNRATLAHALLKLSATAELFSW